ncbi:MAG: DUF1501 domain-containing protein [Ferrovibrio sp.]
MRDDDPTDSLFSTSTPRSAAPRQMESSARKAMSLRWHFFRGAKRCDVDCATGRCLGSSAGHGNLSRRVLLGMLCALAGQVVLPSSVLAAATRPETCRGRLIVVFLRGAYDGLSALIPWSDPHYAALRPNIAIPVSGRQGETALILDDTFALHPALASLLPLWQAGVLAVIPCAGSPHPTRSHFEAQYHWETGQIDSRHGRDGWLNALAGSCPGSVAVGVANALPRILHGAAAVRIIPSGAAATRAGVLDQPAARAALERFVDGSDDSLSRAFRSGMDDRLDTARSLREEMAACADISHEMRQASNGAGAARNLRLDAGHLGLMMRHDGRLRFGFLSAGGWDTHANQGASRGILASNLAALADALVELRRHFHAPHDVIAVVSEFGRTVAENGTRGTDHGHGNALWLLGDAVRGGRWHGRWEGLARERLYEGRDLPVHHDFRAIFAHLLAAIVGLSKAEAQRLFPGHAEDAMLAGLMKAD